MTRFRQHIFAAVIFILLLGMLTLLASTDIGGAGFLHTLIVWVNTTQRRLYSVLAAAVRHAKDTSSQWPLLILFGISFLYGVLHAIGPGHGKVVISSYLVASGSQIRKGLVISFASALVQAASAVTLVGLLALALHFTRLEIDRKGQLLEEASYGLIILLGLWMLVSSFKRDGHLGHRHGHGEFHDHAVPAERPATGFALPRHNWRHYAAVITVTGIRPCSGAILVLLFALAQGIFLAGVAATFIMALGTSLTISALAILAVLSRHAAMRVVGEDS